MTSAKRSRSGTGSDSSSGCCAITAETAGRRRPGAAWRRFLPDREKLAKNRWLRPIAHRVLHPSLWRFNRRSVPRGVALGLFMGILVPLAQIPAAAAFAFPVRANVPVAISTTLVTNPMTIPPLWVAAYWVGSALLNIDAALPGTPIADQFSGDRSWMDWLLADAAPATALGLIAIAATVSTIGFFATTLGWRWWVGRKWRKRLPRTAI